MLSSFSLYSIEAFGLFFEVNFYAYGDVLQVPTFLSGSIAVPALQRVARPDVKLRLRLKSHRGLT